MWTQAICRGEFELGLLLLFVWLDEEEDHHHEKGWMLRRQSRHHVESGPRGKRTTWENSLLHRPAAPKWNNKLDSSTRAAQPTSLLYPASFKSKFAEHVSSLFSASLFLSLLFHIFSLFNVYRCNVSGRRESITYRCWFLLSYFTVALLKHWRRFHLFCNNYLFSSPLLLPKLLSDRKKTIWNRL